MVDAIEGHELLSFLDTFPRYNHILMHPDDEEKTSFISEGGTYCYKKMRFGLKNARATFQILINRMFTEMLRKSMEVYIDDMLVKSTDVKDHIRHLEECFSVLWKNGIKLNRVKCTFIVSSEKFLGFQVTQRGSKLASRKLEHFKTYYSIKF